MPTLQNRVASHGRPWAPIESPTRRACLFLEQNNPSTTIDSDREGGDKQNEAHIEVLRSSELLGRGVFLVVPLAFCVAKVS